LEVNLDDYEGSLFASLLSTIGMMPKTSISWKSIWIYLKSQIDFWIWKFNLNQPEKVSS
jgi:hypothetical protein